MKKLLLTGLINFCCISIVNATCTPPTTLKCECAHPIIENGQLACGSSYCGDKKCMPNGSCCETEKYCEVGDTKYCCAEGQTCDTTSGCVEGKADIETLCANAGGVIIPASSGTFCRTNYEMSWNEAKEWCEENGMTMPTMKEMCPTWDGTSGDGKCSELNGTGYINCTSELCIFYAWSTTLEDSEHMFTVNLRNGDVYSFMNIVGNTAFCH